MSDALETEAARRPRLMALAPLTGSAENRGRYRFLADLTALGAPWRSTLGVESVAARRRRTTRHRMPVLSTLMFLSALSAGAIAAGVATFSRMRLVFSMLTGFAPIAGLVGLWFAPAAWKYWMHGPHAADSEGGPYTLLWATSFATMWISLALAAAIVGALAGWSARWAVLRILRGLADVRHHLRR